MAKHNAVWRERPTSEDFSAALDYLTLQLPSKKAEQAVARARRQRPTERAAKDVLRASRLPLLPPDERHVANDLKKIRKGKALSPVILVQGDFTNGQPPV